MLVYIGLKACPFHTNFKQDYTYIKCWSRCAHDYERRWYLCCLLAEKQEESGWERELRLKRSGAAWLKYWQKWQNMPNLYPQLCGIVQQGKMKWRKLIWHHTQQLCKCLKSTKNVSLQHLSGIESVRCVILTVLQSVDMIKNTILFQCFLIIFHQC